MAESGVVMRCWIRGRWYEGETWAASEPNWFLLMFFSWRRMTKRKFRRGLERLRQAMAALWSDSNWSVTETEETRLWDWRAVSQSITWPDLWVGSRSSSLNPLTNEKGCGCCVTGECSLFHRNSNLLKSPNEAKESRKILLKEWGCKLVSVG